MPFTFAHPAIVLPLKHLPKRWFSLTGLVVGSMTPDFEYFIRTQIKGIYGHTPAGIFYFDLPLGLLIAFIYLRLVRDKLIDHLPAALSGRFLNYRYIPLRLSFIAVLITGSSVVIGAASHILWDSFTHPGGYFVRIIPWLSAVALQLGNHPVYGYKLMQHGSTLLGLVFIIYTIWLLPKKEIIKLPNGLKYWFTVLSVSLLTVAGKSLLSTDLYQFGNLLVTAIAGAFIGLIVSSVLTFGSSKP